MAFQNNRVDIGCHLCDRSVTTFSTGKDLNSFHLRKLVKWVKNPDCYGGTFEYTRQHKPFISCLPTGLPQAAARLSKFSSSLEQLPLSADYIDHTLVTSFLNGRSKWLADYDKAEIKNLQLHICSSAANSKYKSLCDQNCLCKEEKEEGTKPGHHNHGVDDKDDNHKGGHQEHEMPCQEGDPE